MPTGKPIRGKIAAVVSDRAVVINRGKTHGVTSRMKFQINLVLERIQDPDDPQNLLEGISYKKGTITVSQVLDKMSFCSIEGERHYYDDYAWPEDVDNDEPGEEQHVEIEYPKVAAPLIKPDDWAIRVGDTVVEVQEPPKSPEA